MMQQREMFVEAEDRRLFEGLRSVELVISRLPSAPLLKPVDIASALFKWSVFPEKSFPKMRTIICC